MRKKQLEGGDKYSSRSSLREDLVLVQLEQMLQHKIKVAVLDVCSGGDFKLPRLLAKESNPKRINYLAIDSDLIHIRNLELYEEPLKRKFNTFKALLRQVPDLGGLEESVDLIVINNALHEIAPRLYPEMFDSLNRLLSNDGSIIISDMEALQQDEPNAITFQEKDARDFLKAGGFSASVTAHPKAVKVFHAVIKPSASVEKKGMQSKLDEILTKKVQKILTFKRRNPHLCQAKVSMLDSCIARIVDELFLLKGFE